MQIYANEDEFAAAALDKDGARRSAFEPYLKRLSAAYGIFEVGFDGSPFSRGTIMPPANIKLVYLNRLPIGSAVSWRDASLVLSARLDQRISVAEAMNLGTEALEGFYLTIRRLTPVNAPLARS